MLKIAPNLSLPVDAVTSTFAILAIRGVGKTHTASVLAEEMLAAGQPIVAYDPTGAWWGLKSSADGKRPGFPVVVFGGEHADVPLEESAGETIAQTIVEKRISAILDCGLMRKGARVRFMTEFCEALYRLNREPLHLFVDEAHTVAPQRSMPDTARLLGAVEDIVLQGRRRGIGMTIISQRPALVNTNVRSQCGTLIAMRIIGPHDRKAITEWTEAHGTPEQTKEMLASLAKLPRGDAWVWSPVDDLFRRVHFRDRKTFDSSATPTVGGKAVKPQRMAEVDLAALGEAIKATVERAKADDPRELKRKIAALEKQVATLEKEKATEVIRIDVPSLSDEQLKELCALSQSSARIVELIASVESKVKPTVPILMSDRLAAHERRKTMQPPPSLPTRPLPVKIAKGSTPSESGSLGRCERAILAVLACFPAGRNKSQASILSGYSIKSSSFSNALSSLRTKGYMEGGGDRLTITQAGAGALGEIPPMPTGESLRNYWYGQLGKAERAILEAIVDAFPCFVSYADIAERSGYSQTSSSFSNALSKLRTLELIIGRGEVKASDVLFD